MDTVKFGNFISAIRKEKGITQEDLAEKLNVSKQAVSNWEKGKNFPDVSLFEKLAFELDITVQELHEGKRNIETTGISKESTLIEKQDPIKKLFSITKTTEYKVFFISTLIYIGFILVSDYIPWINNSQKLEASRIVSIIYVISGTIISYKQYLMNKEK